QRFADIRPFLILTIVGLGLCWIAPLTRGKAIFVGVALVVLWLWMIGEAAGTDAYSAAPIPSPPAPTTFSLSAFSEQASVSLHDLDPTDPLYPLAQECASGDNAACDSLYISATSGSDFQEFAASCGGTFAGPPGDCEGLSSTSPSTFPSTLNPRQLPRVGNG